MEIIPDAYWQATIFPTSEKVRTGEGVPNLLSLRKLQE